MEEYLHFIASLYSSIPRQSIFLIPINSLYLYLELIDSSSASYIQRHRFIF